MIIDGKQIAQDIYKDLATKVSEWEWTPKLAAVLVGNNPASLKYIDQKRKNAEKVGIDFELIHVAENISQEDLLQVLNDLNTDADVSGYIVQLPLPQHIDTSLVIESISPEKDVDGFHPVNQGKGIIGDDSGFIPCTPAGVMHILHTLSINLAGKEVSVIGKSNIVGKPLVNLLMNAGATVTSCNSKTKDLKKHTSQADIVILAAGVPKMLTADMISHNTIVIDVGFSIIDGKIYGDADFESIEKNGNLITPVPGGVGRLTVAMLLSNTFKAYKMK